MKMEQGKFRRETWDNKKQNLKKASRKEKKRWGGGKPPRQGENK